MFSKIILIFAALSIPCLAATSTCLANNCERAFNGAAYTVGAKEFCANFTTATTTNTGGFPAYATPACSLVAQISSVCSCAYPAITTTKSKSGCLQDNCLRAFEHNSGQGFCSSFTLGGASALPPYATMCTGSTYARVSSACSCLNGGSNTTASTSSGSLISSKSSTSSSSASSSALLPRDGLFSEASTAASSSPAAASASSSPIIQPGGPIILYSASPTATASSPAAASSALPQEDDLPISASASASMSVSTFESPAPASQTLDPLLEIIIG